MLLNEKKAKKDCTKYWGKVIPVPFECEYAIKVNDCSKVESALHIAFEPSRINPSREYFRIRSSQAIAILKLLDQQEITPELNEELNNNVSLVERNSGKKLKKRPNFNFAEMNIPDASELVFYKDSNVTVTVSGDTQVKFNDRITSLTAATKEIMDLDYSVQPSPYWIFEGRLLRDIYNETYSDEENS